MKPTIGRIVHFVMPSGTIRPAMVVSVSGDLLNLQVFLDGPNDLHNPDNGVLPGTAANGLWWVPSVGAGAADQVQTWHWPVREDLPVPAAAVAAAAADVPMPVPDLVAVQQEAEAADEKTIAVDKAAGAEETPATEAAPAAESPVSPAPAADAGGAE
jgi:hypothetical protein